MTLQGHTTPLIAVVGATGTGKSDFALRLSREIRRRGGRAEIVGADAMQLYRGMDIGTAKVSQSERDETPHHLIDVLDPHEEATVASYQKNARSAITNIQSRTAVPIIVGGSGLYVNAALYEFDFPGADETVRAKIEEQLASGGLEPLVAQLTQLDPAASETVDLRNPRRVVRALEVLEVTGRPIAQSLPTEPTPWQPVFIIGVHEERHVLTARLDRRVTKMWRDGLLDEVKQLIPIGLLEGPTASRAIGYAQAAGQLDGELTEEDAIAETQRLTRRYARRQVSWFKRLPRVRWITSGEATQSSMVRKLIAEWSSP